MKHLTLYYPILHTSRMMDVARFCSLQQALPTTDCFFDPQRMLPAQCVPCSSTCFTKSPRATIFWNLQQYLVMGIPRDELIWPLEEFGRILRSFTVGENRSPAHTIIITETLVEFIHYRTGVQLPANGCEGQVLVWCYAALSLNHLEATVITQRLLTSSGNP